MAQTGEKNIIKAVGLEIEYTRPSEVREGVDKGTYGTVGYEEDARIISMFVEGIGRDRIAKILHRSGRTPKEHRDNHNLAITRVSFCNKCRRAGSEFQSIKV